MVDDPLVHVSAGVLSAHLPGEAILLDLNAKRYYRLNETAACVWKALEERVTPANIVERLMTQFEVDHETAEAETARLFAELRARNLLA